MITNAIVSATMIVNNVVGPAMSRSTPDMSMLTAATTSGKLWFSAMGFFVGALKSPSNAIDVCDKLASSESGIVAERYSVGLLSMAP